MRVTDASLITPPVVSRSRDHKISFAATINAGVPLEYIASRYHPIDISDESGRYEIYVLSFPGGDGKRQVSVNGGQQARWRSDGRELYYVEGDTLMAVSVSTESAFTLGQPQRLFEAPGFALTGYFEIKFSGQRYNFNKC